MFKFIKNLREKKYVGMEMQSAIEYSMLCFKDKKDGALFLIDVDKRKPRFGELFVGWQLMIKDLKDTYEET